MRLTPIAMAVLVLLAGCAAPPRLQTVKVAVPVQCDQQVPDRPQMPTEQLKPGVTLFAYVKASQAEIERRQGYEVKLRAALEACTRPIDPTAPGP